MRRHKDASEMHPCRLGFILHVNFVMAIYILWTRMKKKTFTLNLIWRGTLTSEPLFGNWKPFKNDENCFLFHLKCSFPSQDIWVFALKKLKTGGLKIRLQIIPELKKFGKRISMAKRIEER